ncbi:hypothetical protein HGG71_14505 [Rhodobacteraceae bacterium R_SAG2]|jgi:hypothetical protein|nr:hypothetical protein [Rhodobacteraceae bacterium R_SAG2]
MLLSITNAGHAARQAALVEGRPLAKLDRFVIASGPTVGDLVSAASLEGVWYEAPITTKENLSSSSTKLSAEIPSGIAGKIGEVGLLMEDGTLFAAAKFSPDTDGQFKGTGFSFSFFGVISDEDLSDLNITYAALDVDALAQQIADDATARINAQIDAAMIQTVRHLSGLNREVLTQQDKMNTLEAMNV